MPSSCPTRAARWRHPGLRACYPGGTGALHALAFGLVLRAAAAW